MYKDLLIAVEAGRVDVELVKQAAQLAGGLDASLIVAILSPMAPVPLPLAGFGAGGGFVIESPGPEEEAEAKKRLVAAEEEVRRALESVKVPFAIRGLAGTAARLSELIVTLAHASDLFLCYNPFKDDVVPIDRAMFEDVLGAGACGALVWPRGFVSKGPVERVVIAWNRSPEAARAVRVAMPFLVRAQAVTVLLVDPELRPAGDDWRPGDELVEHLARYGVKANLARVASADRSVAEAIEAELEHQGARMLVMGAYGKNALKDWVLGSVARRFLEIADVPILMSN